MKTFRALAAAFAFAAIAAQAGGPLGLCGTAPIKYPGAGTVNLNYDSGTLGARSKAEADSIVAEATALWTNVGTSTVTIGRGADLPVDVTAANFSAYYNRFGDGVNPVIYDTDGTIIDSLLGVGARTSVLGFAGSASSGCNYVEGQAIINGYLNVSRTTMVTVIAHEVGHLIGLDHTQLDNTQGLTGSNYPLMYPIAYRTLASLHEDDISAVSALYPAGNVASVYGTLQGNFTLANGTAVRGANIWAQDVANPGRVYSSVSDYLTQGNGFFRMLVPPGTYTLHAEAIQSQFDGGSSVGPYSDSYPGSPSFQSPLYSGGAPMAPLTMGNSVAIPVTIVAGCTASAAFRFDGSGSVSGNCVTSALSTTTVASSANPSAVGQGVTLTATVSGPSGAPTGTVEFRGNGITLAGCAAVALSAGRASCNASFALAGTVTINAFYSGSGAYTASSGAFAQSILAATVPGRLGNLSTRGPVGSGNSVMIGGFVISGAGAKTVIVRAIGPSLTQYGIANALPNPTLQLMRVDGTVLATNDDWGTAANAAQVAASGFAPTNPFESAILTTLSPGAYTAIVAGAGGTTGVGLVEVYEIDRPDVPLINLSTRGEVGSGTNVMIGGIVIQGNTPRTVVIRAIGPSLTQYGIANALANPTLQLMRVDGTVIATNDNWASGPNAAQIQVMGLAPTNGLESAIYATLAPGAYTAVVSGAGGATGVGMIEVYLQ